MKRFFVAGTGTEVGKTIVTRAIAAACVGNGMRVAALKPVETGATSVAADAPALANACGQPDLAFADGFYRASAPLAPLAIEYGGGPVGPSVEELVTAVEQESESAELQLVEGCGGLMVPISSEATMLDFAAALGAPVVVVGPNRLGVLSDVLTTVKCAEHAGLTVAAVVLNQAGSPGVGDVSPRSNAAVLASTLRGVPVVSFPRTDDDDAKLAEAAARSRLLSVLKLA